MIPLSRRDNPDTSRQAAIAVANSASEHREKICTCLAFYGAQTAHEIAAKINLQPHQVLKRMSELEREGLCSRIYEGTKDGKPIYRTRRVPTSSNRAACVWVATNRTSEHSRTDPRQLALPV